MSYKLPAVATAPFCPSEVRGAVAVPAGLPLWRKLLRAAGPGLLVAVGYMDPGNWATDIAAGSRFGYDLLFVVLLTSLAAILLQSLAMRLGLVAGHDLARMARERYSRGATVGLWLLAELAIVATDVAEVLGSALAFNLLLGVPLWLGVLLTALDTIVVLGLKGNGFRQVEAIILGLVTTIAVCFAVQLVIAGPSLSGILHGAVPKLDVFSDPQAIYLAVGILGATVMPHNLYLHSSIVQTRVTAPGEAALKQSLRFATVDIVVSLLLATLVNGAILTLAAATFHDSGYANVAEIEEAYHLLAPLTGAAAAAILFGIALFASGQSATFTGTIAGQVILEGFLDLKIPCWQRRIITRGLALVPALAGVLWLGDHAVGKLLVLTQVVLSLQLPFAIYPLIRFTSDRGIMGVHASGAAVRVAAWGVFAVIVAANLWLIVQMV
ncbi:Nramp family divalent metal transporter [Sphingomonas sp. H39-1-10]|uniref:Nramp family divalent metal transporter n=1 Tax=Sphingomonas TaxID=13687 RepID=UPI000B89F2A4|nr:MULTISPECIES: Nramp family divalent metal transporter [Sphingomonas]MDF0488376.1 Nramp family divalent metal transporter [Sphingomonas pollutisoli]